MRCEHKKLMASTVIAPLLSFALTLPVSAQIVTDVTPGSVEPARDSELLPEKEQGTIFVVPTPSERNVSPQGVTITVSEFTVVYDVPQQIAKSSKQGLQTLLGELAVNNEGLFDFAQLEDVAQQATEYLRNAGYLLARAVLPPQEVEQNTIRLNVYVGTLGDVYALDNAMYAEHQLVAPFKSQGGSVIKQTKVESSLLRLRDLPGLEAIARFEPGSEVGTANIGVQVTEEDRFEYRLRVDNHGADPTGKLRLLGGVSINNPLGIRDKLSVDAVQTFDAGDLTNVRARYEITEPALYHTFGMAYSETHYDVDSGQAKIFDIHGDTEIADLYVYSQWQRSRRANFATNLELSTKRAESDSNIDGLLDGVDRLTVASLTLIADGVDSKFRGIHRATLGFHKGFNDFIGSMDEVGNRSSLGEIPGSSGPLSELPGEFEKVTATYNRLQSISANHSLLIKLAGQYSDDILSSLEKMSLGGPYTVRAYPVAEFVAERATYASLAWVVNGSVFGDPTVYGDYALGDVFSLSIFADYGWGKNKNLDGSATRRELDGAGIQFDFLIPDRDAYLELIAAHTLGGDEAFNGDKFQFWFNVGVEF